MINLYVKSQVDENVCFIFRDSGEEIRVALRTRYALKGSPCKRGEITPKEYDYIKKNFKKPTKVF